MTELRARLATLRRRLALAATGRAAAVVVATVCAVLLAGAAADALVALPLALRRALAPLAALAGVAAYAIEHRRRVGPAWRASDEAVALWFERRLPALRYALVTAVDPAGARAVDALVPALQAAPLEREAASAARALLVRPLAAAALASAALLLAPRGAVARVAAPAPGDLLARPGEARRATADPLAHLVVRVTPPAYSGLPARTLEDPSSVAALRGSRLLVEGLGADVTARLDSAPVRVAAAGDGWRVALDVPARAAGLRLRAGARERVLVLEPVADSAPAVRLDAPARDSVLRTATGRVALEAEARDDLGLADAAFEFIVSSGAGETFEFRSGRVGARALGGARTGRLAGALRLDTLGLGPGDLVHLRAVARDRNDVTGPGTGASETRTLRIARADEYDSVSVDPLPPTEPEKNALSQRMILMLTMELRDRAPRLGAPAVQRESRRLAVEQTKLRKRVGEIVFTRLSEDQGEHAHFAGDGHEHGAERPLDPDQVLAAAERAANVDPTRALEGEGDETPVVAINRPMLEAYNHMWRASSALETADPAGAVPWMERAIEALQRARAAERIYLRGRPPRVVVDLAKVRMTGRDKGASSLRAPRAPLDAGRAARLARFDATLGVVAADPAAAADSLLLLRLSLPPDDGATAQALDAAADAARRGGDVTAALQRARRALAGPPARAAALTGWGR